MAGSNVWLMYLLEVADVFNNSNSDDDYDDNLQPWQHEVSSK